MSAMFEELDYQPTEIGAISLRRRRDLRLGQDVLEIKLGEEFLMTSAFTASEVALARLGVAACGGDALDVVVGGLGLGYTAEAVLASDRVGHLDVVEYLQPVIEWHETGLLPLGPVLTGDPRCRLIRGDFFALTASSEGYDPAIPGRRYDALLVDIDHSPEALLDARSTSFYCPEGLSDVLHHLKPGGIFGLWSNEPPDAAFTARLAGVFAEAWAETVVFDNPLQGKPFTQAVYLARA
jgi:spermidine synthase